MQRGKQNPSRRQLGKAGQPDRRIANGDARPPWKGRAHGPHFYMDLSPSESDTLSLDLVPIITAS